MRLRLPLIACLLIPVLGTVIAGLGFASWRIGSLAERTVLEAADREMDLVADDLARQIGEWAGMAQTNLAFWRQEAVYVKSLGDGFVAEQARKQASDRLAALKQAYPDFDALHLVDAAGDVIASSDPAQVGKLKLGERAYVKDALAGTATFSDAFPSKRTGKPVVALGAPVGTAGAVKGVLVGIVDLSAIAERTVGRYRIGETGYACLFDAAGNVASHPDPEMILNPDAALGKLPFGDALRRAAGSGEAGQDHIRYVWQDKTKQAAVRTIPGVRWLIATTIGLDEVLAPAVEQRRTVLVIAGIALLAVSLVVVVIAIFIVRPIRRTAAVLDAVSAGRLDSPPVHSLVAEIEWMNGCLVCAQTGMQQALGTARADWQAIGRQTAQRQQLTTALAEASQRLSATSSRLAAAAGQASDQATNVGAAAEEASRNIQTAASGSEEMAASIREIARTTGEASKVADAALNDAEAARGLIDRLGESSQRIGEVIGTINSIARQTNLLALNATIEAARAGEAGRGFAVVAGEVKNLSQQTAGATADIQQRVGGIQQDIAAAVEAMQRIAGTIRDIHGHQATIASAVEEQTATTQEITGNVGEAAKASGEIAGAVQGVAAASRQAASGAAEARAEAERLARLAADLRGG
jgi:methyl-accepting chemotaxis protein